MNTIPGTVRPSRPKLLRAAAVAWVVLISTGTIVNHVPLSKLSTRADASAQSMQVTALEARLDELGQQIEAQRQQPDVVTVVRFEAEHQALEQRLTDIELGLKGHPTAESLSTLEVRVGKLESDATKTPQPAPALTKKQASKPKPRNAAEPPFTVVGLELRGGERFLSILPTGSPAPSKTGVLRPGETEAGWRLEAIEDHTAVLQSEGRVLRIVAP
ncbi:TPA: hypothetical protein L4Q76_001670 [Pseudomonas aeruginosa]|uniref:hypothetical protein n=1 Tax=Pseudomonas aeruginosa TaxID=287 RepID=UPI0003B9AF27|nr:hypothetical protein [Pseudomonas aeruginosa]EKT9493093.1 hypothetical protein [Pseudomonas aeruginosa]ERY35609.1 hypothetical protein Q067_02244 [Pseudomonas aeruginosa BL13]MBH4028460.1 hypothetical protein [Pseudomonas aeruginosa]MBV5530570.1 hypothetical protein [Pseudomonas aeruginosa]MCS8095385.1 hypothetical protein [Pseudomonas aeruginosa]